MTRTILHNLQNTNLQNLSENSILCNFQQKNMLDSTQKAKETDLDYYVINHQRFRAAYIILYNLQNTDL